MKSRTVWLCVLSHTMSPPAREVWIEMLYKDGVDRLIKVTSREGGVD